MREHAGQGASSLNLLNQTTLVNDSTYQQLNLLLLLPVRGVAADEDDEEDEQDEEDDAGDEEGVVDHVVERRGAPRVEEQVAHRAIDLNERHHYFS